MIKPWGRYIAVEDPPADEQDGTVSGIHLPPGMGLDILSKGVVIGVGPRVEGAEGSLKPGDVIWYQHHGALELGIKEQVKFVLDQNVICYEEN